MESENTAAYGAGQWNQTRAAGQLRVLETFVPEQWTLYKFIIRPPVTVVREDL